VQAESEQARPWSAEGEVLRFRWRLEGVQGFVARLLSTLPTSGDAVMTLATDDEGRLEVVFRATSEKADEDEHWTYETLVDLDDWRTVRVRETYKFREKEREKNFDLEALQVIDVLSGLQRMRYEPRSAVGRSTIWSDAKTYPVAVTSGGTETREIGGRELALRRYDVRGYRVPDKRLWKARAEVWLTSDQAALPAEILYRQSLGKLRLTLVDPLP
jgi:hypothetical protein